MSDEFESLLRSALKSSPYSRLLGLNERTADMAAEASMSTAGTPSDTSPTDGDEAIETANALVPESPSITGSDMNMKPPIPSRVEVDYLPPAARADADQPDMLRIRDLPEDERPRERLREHGPDTLATSELIALLLGCGMHNTNVRDLALNLLREYDGLEMLSRASRDQLCKIKGIGDAKASVLLAAFEIGRRAAHERAIHDLDMEKIPDSHSDKIGCDIDSFKIAEMMTPLLRDKAQEELWVIMLDVRNQYRGKTKLYQGTCNSMMANSSEVLSTVVGRRSPHFAIVHNHPSGRSYPSTADISFTQKLVRASESLDVDFVDHVIVGRDMESWTSIRRSMLVDFE